MYLLSKIEKDNETLTYQGIQFSSTQFERELELLKEKKNSLTESICACIFPADAYNYCYQNLQGCLQNTLSSIVIGAEHKNIMFYEYLAGLKLDCCL